MTALRLTPMSPAISRQDRPASKRLFRSSMRSAVQVRWLASMLMFSQATSHHAESCWPRCLRTAAPRRFPLWRLAVVADRKQPVLDGEPNAFLDQRPCDAGNAGAVGALSHQLFEIGDGGERQRYRMPVGFGLSSGDAKKLAVNGCTENGLRRLFLDTFGIEVKGGICVMARSPHGAWEHRIARNG